MNFTIALFLFFLTGLSGLIYQVVWMKQMTLTFGVTAFATSTVLSAFMGGLGLGSFVAGRWIKPGPRALQVYGLLEIGVGLSALVLPVVWQWLTPLFQALYRNPIPFVDLTVWRFVLSFISLCVPTTFMGATLPVISQGLVAQLNQVGQRVGRLYALNTLGAMLGAFASGFLLIGLIGIRTTTLIAVVINIVVGLIALALASRRPFVPTADPATQPSAQPRPNETLIRRLVMLTMFVAGFVGLAYEVVWTRVMVLIFDSNVYSFAAMLTMVLFGIAFGSWLISRRLDQNANPLATLGLVELGLGVCAIVWLFQIARSFDLIAWMENMPLLSTLKNSLAFPLMMSFWSLLVPTTLMGMTFPLATRILTHAVSDVSRNVGQVYTINVLGGVLGSFMGGFVLLPWLGAQDSVWLLASLSIGVGLLVCWHALPTRRRSVQSSMGIAAVVIVGGFFLPDVLFTPLFIGKWPERKVIANLERIDGMVTVTQDGEYRTMYTNGYPQSSTAPYWLKTYHVLGLLPNIVKADSKQMLVVGMGSGVTSGAAHQIPDLQMHIIELSPGMVEAATYFAQYNFNVTQQPRVNIKVDDGRNTMLLDPTEYDVIIADTIAPINAFANNLYSREYFQLYKSRLKPDGIAAQWIDSSLPAPLYKIVMRTFLEVFPDAIFWQEQDRFVMLGARGPIKLDLEAMQARYSLPALKDSRQRLGYATAKDLVKPFTPNGQFMTGAVLRDFIGDGLSLSDDRPLLEYAVILIEWEKWTGQKIFGDLGIGH